MPASSHPGGCRAPYRDDDGCPDPASRRRLERRLKRFPVTPISHIMSIWRLPRVVPKYYYPSAILIAYPNLVVERSVRNATAVGDFVLPGPWCAPWTSRRTARSQRLRSVTKAATQRRGRYRWVIFLPSTRFFAQSACFPVTPPNNSVHTGETSSVRPGRT